MTAPLALLDGAGLWFRAFHALPESLTAPDGTPVNAVRGFADMLGYVLRETEPDEVVVCLDADWRPGFRVRALPSYKAHRVDARPVPDSQSAPQSQSDQESEPEAEAVPDGLSAQVPMILQLLDALGIATAEAAGYEADDVMGTLATRENRRPVEVVTGDRDLFQLVRHDPTPVRVRYVGGGIAKAQLLGSDELARRYGLASEQVGRAYAEMSMLRGDPSDGLPGVPGIGEKTAATLLQRFGDLASVRAAAISGDAGLTGSQRTKLVEAADYLDAAEIVVRVVTEATIVRSAPAKNVERATELAELWNLGGAFRRLEASLQR